MSGYAPSVLDAPSAWEHQQCRASARKRSKADHHHAGFEAWLRNQQGLGKTGAFNSEDLLRKSKAFGGDMGIEATDSTSQPLPPLTATAVRFDTHGPPEAGATESMVAAPVMRVARLVTRRYASAVGTQPLA